MPVSIAGCTQACTRHPQISVQSKQKTVIGPEGHASVGTAAGDRYDGRERFPWEPRIFVICNNLNHLELCNGVQYAQFGFIL